MWLTLTPDGRIGDGPFGASFLVDLATLEYTVVLSRNAGDITWSSDYRYAAVGFQFGHGGPCG